MKRDKFIGKWGLRNAVATGQALFDCSESLEIDLNSVISQACKEQREICANAYRTYEGLNGYHKETYEEILTAIKSEGASDE
jgi:hypothetical protein